MSGDTSEVWITKTEMADLLGLNRNQLYKFINDGVLVVHKLSGKMPRYENERIWNTYKTRSIVRVPKEAA